MIDFILRHGNDLLAVDCLKGFEVGLATFECLFSLFASPRSFPPSSRPPSVSISFPYLFIYPLPPLFAHSQGTIMEQGKILRQGDLTVVERTRHRRRVFLFEKTIVLAKRKKGDKYVAGSSDAFHFKAAYKVGPI